MTPSQQTEQNIQKDQQETENGDDCCYIIKQFKGQTMIVRIPYDVSSEPELFSVIKTWVEKTFNEEIDKK